MKVNEKLQNNYITATERYSRPPARYELEELKLVVHQPTRQRFLPLSTENVEKGNLDGQESKIYAIDFAIWKSS
jgi:DNA topoisomerase-1